MLNSKKIDRRVLFFIVGAMVSSALYMAVLLPAVELFCIICVLFNIGDKKRILFLSGAIGFTGLLYFLFSKPLIFNYYCFLLYLSFISLLIIVIAWAIGFFLYLLFYFFSAPLPFSPKRKT